MTEKRKTKKSRDVKALQPFIEKMLRGNILVPDEHNDRQALARTADFIRSVAYVPVTTVRVEKPGGKAVIGYKMTQADIAEYHGNRAAQKARQEAAIIHAQRQRDARRAALLFADLGIPLPPEVEALARKKSEPEPEIEHYIDDNGVIQKAS